MVVDEQGRMWVGTRKGVAVREGERFRRISMPNAPDERVYGMAREPSGGMLIGTVCGVLLIPGLYFLFGKLSERKVYIKDEEENPLTEEMYHNV